MTNLSLHKTHIRGVVARHGRKNDEAQAFPVVKSFGASDGFVAMVTRAAGICELPLSSFCRLALRLSVPGVLSGVTPFDRSAFNPGGLNAHTVTFWVSEAQNNDVNAAIGIAGVTFSEFCRSVIGRAASAVVETNGPIGLMPVTGQQK